MCTASAILRAARPFMGELGRSPGAVPRAEHLELAGTDRAAAGSPMTADHARAVSGGGPRRPLALACSRCGLVQAASPAGYQLYRLVVGEARRAHQAAPGMEADRQAEHCLEPDSLAA
jgi:hypothetical protein